MSSTGTPTRIAVIHYSATGNVYRLAAALATGAREVGADVRLLRVAELAPEAVILANPRWIAHREFAETIPIATLTDLEWADGVALGSPTRFGLPSAQLKNFVDQTGALWAKGLLADKVGTSFTSASTLHGGLETTLVALNNLFYHWGSVIMPVGYTADVLRRTGNPYGASWVSRRSAPPDDDATSAAMQQGRRLACLAAVVRGAFDTAEHG